MDIRVIHCCDELWARKMMIMLVDAGHGQTGVAKQEFARGGKWKIQLFMFACAS